MGFGGWPRARASPDTSEACAAAAGPAGADGPGAWCGRRPVRLPEIGREWLSRVTNAFLTTTLPMLDREGIDLNVYAVTSTELFDLLPPAERAKLFPEAHQQEAMGITDFTLATMTRWVRSDYGRAHTLHPFRHGHFLGSGPGAMVMAEAGLDGDSQFVAIRDYVHCR